MYGHAHLLLSKCEDCGNGPRVVVTNEGKMVCARCGLADEKENAMSVKCGSCKQKHNSVDEVKDCYAQAQYDADQAKAEALAEQRAEQWWEERGGAVDDPREREAWAREDLARETAAIQQREREDDARAYASKPDRQEDLISALEQSVREKRFIDEEEEERAARLLDGMTGSPGRDMASEAQVNYAMDLLKERVWPDDLTRSDVENMERRQVSKLIDQLKIARKKAGVKTAVLSADDWKDIPAGRYAFVDPGDDGVSYSYVDRQDLVPFRERKVRFYQVDFPTKPMWRGRVFVSQLFGSPGDYRKEPRRGDAGRAILEAIAVDPKAAMETFGKESGVCGRCKSPLTNEESLASGIGPICRGKLGW